MLKALGVSLVTTTKNTFYSDSSLALQTAIDGKGIIVAGSIIAAQALASGHFMILEDEEDFGPYNCPEQHLEHFPHCPPRANYDSQCVCALG